jgi:hypothetical protein
MHSLAAEHAAPMAFWGTQLWPSQKLPLAQSPLVLQDDGHDPFAPSHRYGAQLGVPAVPVANGAHVPALGRSHASQAPRHGALQHTPSAQYSPAQALLAGQASPSGSFAAQAPLSHHPVLAQSPSSLQLARHTPLTQA